MKILLVYIKEDAKLKRCLDSLARYSPDIEIVLRKADPKKTKTSEEVYDEYLQSEEFVEDVMIWHPDMVATEGWYRRLMDYYEEFDVIGMKMMYPNKLVNHYGGAIRVDGVGFHPHQNSLNIGLDRPLGTAYVTGPGTVIKKKVYDVVGGYDHQFTYFIDVDFCFRARSAGFTVGVVPVELIHYEGEDNLKTRPLWLTNKMIVESHQKFVAKWMDELVKYR